MLSKDLMIKTLHLLYRSDKWINELFNSVGLSLDNIATTVEELHGNNFFDTATEKAVEMYEKELGITPLSGEPLDNRRASIRAKWIGAGKVDIVLLQEVANSWKNGAIELEFIGGKIHVKFISPLGVPTGLEQLQKALENTKPAHLAMYYTFMWLTWGQARDFGTWGKHKSNGNWLYVKQLKS